MNREIYYADAITEALRQEMRRDERVYIFGEDIAAYGGVFGVTKGLVDEFGPKRVRNTPLSEAAILGEAVGSAIYGMRPVPEIQFADFLTTAISPLVDLAASYHYRISTPVPMTIRAPSGGGMNIGNFHSRCLEAWFAHIPGLKVVIPSTPYDAKGLLLASIRDDNPVLYMEQKKLYRSLRGPVPEELYEVPLGQAALRRQGKDLSVIGYGSILVWAQPLIDQLVSEGIDVEVLDLRTLVPLDYEAIAQTVRKTGRVLLAHEAVKFGGFSGEISAFLAEECFDDLAAPVRRIGSRSTPIPTNPVLEEHYWPQKNEFLEAARNLMTY